MIPLAVPVATEEVAAEAERQAAFNLPRRDPRHGFGPRTPEAALRWGLALARSLRRDGPMEGGFLRVELPLDWLLVAESHLDTERAARLAALGGSRDPVFAEGVYGGDGGAARLGLVNGNNRLAYARAHGWPTLTVYVTAASWAHLLWLRGEGPKPTPGSLFSGVAAFLRGGR